MTPRQTLEALIDGRPVGSVPFLIWDNKLPADPELREALLQAGACVVVKSSVYSTRLASIGTEETRWVDEQGRKWRRTIFHSPGGDLEDVSLIESGSLWHQQPVFKSPEDYESVLTLVSDYAYTPAFDTFVSDDRRFGEQGIARPATEKSPLFEILYDLMGVANFSIEWYENRDSVLALYRALLAKRRERLAILADSPARFAVVDGNIEMSVVGRERFESLYAPVIVEACSMLHEHGKRTGLHLDGNLGALVEALAGMPVDIIESFTPPPECDVKVGQALQAWPEKRLMINFPASLHLAGPEAIRRAVREILDEGGASGRIALGVIEDVPRNDHLPLLARLVQSGC